VHVAGCGGPEGRGGQICCCRAQNLCASKCAPHLLCCYLALKIHRAANSDAADAINIIGIECDVSSERAVQKAYAEIMDTFGRIDSVVASAGQYPPFSNKNCASTDSHVVQVSSRTTRLSSTHFVPNCIVKTLIQPRFQLSVRPDKKAVRYQRPWSVLHGARGRAQHDPAGGRVHRARR
jgi:NAD(P)-dependent dehydrogenase (short-subunit alcohol dehydrogenase family)